jgi:hypothetical protein
MRLSSDTPPALMFLNRLQRGIHDIVKALLDRRKSNILFIYIFGGIFPFIPDENTPRDILICTVSSIAPSLP